MTGIRHIARRLTHPDEDLAIQLRRVFAFALLGYLTVAVLLFLVYALAASAPHPLSLFLGDLVLVIPFLFRVLTLVCALFLVLLLGLRLSVRRSLRGKNR